MQDFILCTIQNSLRMGKKRPVMKIGIDFFVLVNIASKSVSCEIWAPGWLSSKLQRAVEHVSHCCTCSLLKLRCYLTFVPLNGLLKGKLMDNAKQLIMIMI